MLTDCHTHTEASPDSEAPLSEMCRAAREKGIRYYAVTDHVELCRWYPQAHYGADAEDSGDGFDYAARFARSMQQIQAERAQQAENFTLISGVELGEPDADFALAEQIYRDERLDFVLASLHELPGEKDFYLLEYTPDNVEQLLNAYFAELLCIAQQDCFDVLAHLTYPLRFICGRDNISVDMGLHCVDLPDSDRTGQRHRAEHRRVSPFLRQAVPGRRTAPPVQGHGREDPDTRFRCPPSGRCERRS